MEQLKIDYIPISDIKPYKRNAKQHPEEQIQQIANSIREFGFNDPIAIDETNTIIEGHGRILAVKRLHAAGLYTEDTVPVIRLVGLSEQQKKAYILAHNKLTMNTGFDIDILNAELSSIDAFDMADFGFIDEEKPEEDEGEAYDDEYDGALPAEPKSKFGDIYQCGRHILMCGDSTNPEDVRTLLQAGNIEFANLCVTDPPYNVQIENSQGMTIQNDDMGKAPFQEFLTKAFINIADSIYPGASFYIWYAHASANEFINALHATTLSAREQLIWVKNSFTLGRSDYQWRHEPCLYGWKEGASHYFVDDRTQDTVFDEIKNTDIAKLSKTEAVDLIKRIIKERDTVPTTVIYEDKPKANDIHPTMKPVPLIGKFIKNSSRKGDDVLDLFGGSGSTMIACEQLGRRCFTMEYDPRYVDAELDRYESLTGQKAVKIYSKEDT